MELVELEIREKQKLNKLISDLKESYFLINPMEVEKVLRRYFKEYKGVSLFEKIFDYFYKKLNILNIYTIFLSLRIFYATLET